MILCDTDLKRLIATRELTRGLIDFPGKTRENEFDLVNPASVDIRVGRTMLIEDVGGLLEREIPDNGYWFFPGDFALVSTFESFFVPNGYAMDLRLKSTSARQGWDHSLAFWIDPGWKGVLTMEVKNTLKLKPLLLKPGQKFAQVIVHKLSGLAEKPYEGKYNNTNTVSGART